MSLEPADKRLESRGKEVGYCGSEKKVKEKKMMVAANQKKRRSKRIPTPGKTTVGERINRSAGVQRTPGWETGVRL